jgi:hypothetical protein
MEKKIKNGHRPDATEQTPHGHITPDADTNTPNKTNG